MNIVQLAKTLAEVAYDGQKHASGELQVDRSSRVADNLTTDSEKAVGWLQKILSMSPVTVENLRELGFGQPVVDAVIALNRDPSERDYQRVIRRNPLAVRVNSIDASL